jgi:hypothetical protein
MKINRLKRQIKKAITPKDGSIAGFLGRISDNAVTVPNKKNYVYVTLSSGIVVQARNRFTPPALGMAVLLRPIHNDPIHLEIYDIRPSYSQDVDFVLLQNHATNHDWTFPDETRTHLRQFLPLRVMPAAAGGVALDINSGWYETTAGGTAKYLGVTTLDISSYAPSTGARWLLIQLDRTGALVYSVSATKTFPALQATDIPHRTHGIIALAAIRLYPGQSSIRDAANNPDLIDLRLSFYPEGDTTGLTANRIVVTDTTGKITTDPQRTYTLADNKETHGDIDPGLTAENNSLTQGANDVNATHELQVFDDLADGNLHAPTFRGRHGRGDNVDPTSVQVDDVLVNLEGEGYDYPLSSNTYVQVADHETAGPPYEFTGASPSVYPAWKRLPHGGILYYFRQPNDQAEVRTTWAMLATFYFTSTLNGTTPKGDITEKCTIRIGFSATSKVPDQSIPPCVEETNERDVTFTNTMRVERDALTRIQEECPQTLPHTFYGCSEQAISGPAAPIDSDVFVNGIWQGDVYEAALNALYFISGHSASPAFSGWIEGTWEIEIYPGIYNFAPSGSTAPAQIQAIATEDFTPGAHGSRWDVFTTRKGEIAPELSAQISPDGINLPTGKYFMVNDIPIPVIAADITTTLVHAATSKNPPVDADEIPLLDSAASFILAKLTWANIKATLKTYFDGLYNLYVHPNHSGDVTSAGDGAQTIANKVTMTATAPMAVSGTPTVIAGGAAAISIGAASATDPGSMSAADFASLRDGWIPISATGTSGTLDTPVFEISFNADMTGLIGLGDRIRISQATTKYFIVVKVGAFSGGATIISCYGGTDYALVATATTAITLPYLSHVKAPFGFPTSPAKWAVTADDFSQRLFTATEAAWAVPTGSTANISMPIGAWRMRYSTTPRDVATSATYANALCTLSTTTNSETNSTLTYRLGLNFPSAGTVVAEATAERTAVLTVTDKTTLYLLFKALSDGTHGASCGFDGPASIFLESAYL